MQALHHFLKTQLEIPDRLVTESAEYYQEETMGKGDFLVKQGQRCHRLSLITQGYLRFYSHASKKAVTHWIFGQQQMVTDVASFFLQQPAKWNIQALTPTTVHTLHSSQYEKLRTQIPEWDHHEKRFLIKLLSALENRVYTLVSMSAEERFKYLFQADPDMFNELPLQYIASMLGMTAETLSRMRNKLAS